MDAIEELRGLEALVATVAGHRAVLDTYDPNDENLFVVRFTKNFMWDLSHAGNPMMYMRYGEPSWTATPAGRRGSASWRWAAIRRPRPLSQPSMARKWTAAV